MASLAQQRNIRRQTWLRGVISPILLIVLIFLLAGRLDYWQGWVYIGLTALVLGVTVYALRNQRELMEERLSPGHGMKTWDKWYFAFSGLMYFAFLIVACLDAGRFGWTGELSLWVYAISVALFIAGQAIFLWAKRANHFFSSVVRIQTERGHAVCEVGPYLYVRHPGYVGSLILTVVSPLVLGSVWALIPSLIAAALLVVRTRLEDDTLKEELPGYVEYTSRVKYRLLPGVW